MLDAGGVQVNDANSQTAYAYSGKQFVTYDTMATHAAKVDFLCQKNLGGAMVWALDLDTNHQMTAAIHDRIAEKCTGWTVASSGDTCDAAARDACAVRYAPCASQMQQLPDLCACAADLTACVSASGCEL
eukprot:TRINITY_DN4209_c0_g1_i2.p2 TRINITY_DN4209_c0_g1~~TRINITY_DN4209_c0_g1_i2.p2  ORF type:complete len:130 (+),score=43.00 TRINITY_DN4209_c0_g1_i2:370-759(+)